MYHYVDDKVFLGKMRSLCADIVNQLVQRINNDSVMEVKAYLIGSGGINMITQNEKESVDLDYNLCIVQCRPYLTEFKIKEYVKKQFNYVLNRNGWGDCSDSTSALSTEERCFKKGNPTGFKIDLAIVRETPRGLQRLIHDKTGWICFDRWFWNDAPRSGNIEEKAYAIKENGLWLDVRERYLEKKNMYLRRNDHDHHSFMIYIETINEIYYQYFC